MNDDNDFYTETMARVYINQGYLEKAADIYTYLLGKDPTRRDLIEKLSEINIQIKENKSIGKEHLVSLFSHWIDLVLKQNKIKKLKNVSQSVAIPPKYLSDK